MAEKAPQRAVPFIFRLPAHCRVRSDSSGMWPWSPKKATVGVSAASVQAAKVSRLLVLLPLGPSSLSTLLLPRSYTCRKGRRPEQMICRKRSG